MPDKNYKVLVVDDEPQIAGLLKVCLEMHNMKVKEEYDGSKAYELFNAEQFAPFAEELALRAVMLKNSKKAFGMVGCVILTALMFGLMHMNPMQILYAIPMGLLLGFVAYKYNSVVPAIIVHMINNTCSMLIPSLMGRAFSAIEAAIVFVVFFALAVFTYKKLSVRNEQIENTEVAA